MVKKGAERVKRKTMRDVAKNMRPRGEGGGEDDPIHAVIEVCRWRMEG